MPIGPERDIEACLAALETPASPTTVRMLARYLSELEKWNAAYNLTSIRQIPDMIPYHLADSLALLPLSGGGGQWVDVGTGAGLPGIPLAILRPDDSFTLVDSRGKKIRFLNHVVRKLGLANVRPVQIRMEDFLPRPGVDLVVARAFGPLSRLVESVSHWCSSRTRILAMKGQRPDAEIADLPAEFPVREIHKLDVPGLDAERHVIEIVRTESADG